MRSHKDLDCWKESINLVSAVYEMTSFFPKEEIYGLTSQIRRSAVSVPSNIAEGASRQSTKEFIHFLYIAMGSLQELDTQVIIAQNLGFTTSDSHGIAQQIETTGKLLSGLIRYLKQKT